MDRQTYTRRGSPAVRDRLPVRRLPALQVRGLTTTGGLAGRVEIRDLTFSIDAGSLTLVGPVDAMRTVFEELVTEHSDGHERSEAQVIGRCRLVPRSLPSGHRLVDLLDEVGPTARRVARRVGLAPMEESGPTDLQPHHRVLASLAITLAESPDLALLDDPFAAFHPDQTLAFLRAVRDLVDSEGRTILISCTPDQLPPAATSLIDDIFVHVGSASGDQLLAFAPWPATEAPHRSP